MKNIITILSFLFLTATALHAEQVILSYTPVSELQAVKEDLAKFTQPSDSVLPDEKKLHTPEIEESQSVDSEESSLNSFGQEETKVIDAILWGVSTNEKVNYFLNHFKTKVRANFKIWLSRSSQYLPAINKIFEEYGIAEELVFLPLIESGFSPHATSRAQAAGIWQFMKGTAKRYGLRVDKFIDERRDPEKSAKAAAMYLRDLYGMFGSWDLALAAYNAGEGKISRIINKTGSNDFWDVMSHKKVKRETKEYVPRFVAATLIAKEPEEYGFDDISYQTELEVEEILLPAKTTLKSIAAVVDVEEDIIKHLNPAIKNGFLPPDQDYLVRIPMDKKDILTQNLELLKKADQKTIKKVLAKKEKRYAKKRKGGKSHKKVADVKRISSDRKS
jgi:membrane-bound lytic murein transglycosylase D